MKIKKMLAMALATMLTLSPVQTAFAIELEGTIRISNTQTNKEAHKEFEKIIDEILSSSSTPEEAVDKLLERANTLKNTSGASGGSVNLGSYSGIYNEIMNYFFIDESAGTHINTYAELQARANSGTPAPDLQVDQNQLIEVGNQGGSADTVGSAEGGYYESKDSRLTNKELVFRKSKENLKVFEEKLNYVSTQFGKYVQDYQSYEQEVMHPDSPDKHITNHKVVVGSTSNAGTSVTAPSFISGSDLKYNVLADMLKVDLAGLEYLTLANTLKQHGTDTQKDAAESKLQSILKKDGNGDSVLFGSEATSVQRLRNSGGVSDSNKGTAFKLHDSLASPTLKPAGTGGADNEAASEFLQKCYTVSEIFYQEYINHALETADDKVKLEAPKFNPTDNGALQTKYDETVTRNTEDLAKIQDLLSIPNNYGQENPVSVDSGKAGSGYQFSSPLGFWVRFATSNTAQANLNIFEQAPLITNNFTLFENTAIFEDSFLPIELVLYGALDFNYFLKSNGLDVSDAASMSKAATIMNNAKAGYTEVIKLAKSLGNFYTLMGYKTRGESLMAYANAQYTLFNNFVKEVDNGPGPITPEDINIGNNILPVKSEKVKEAETSTKPTEIAIEELKNSEAYYELIAWTAAFTPFETKVTDLATNGHYLSQEAYTTYLKYNAKRSPVYAAEGDKGVISALAHGNTRQLDYITLRDFITRQENSDLVLYTNRYSEDEIYQAKVNGIIVAQAENAEGESETTVKPNGKVDSSNHTDNTAKFFGPIYVSSGDAEYAYIKNDLDKDAKKERESTLEAEENTLNNFKENDGESTSDQEAASNIVVTSSSETGAYLSKLTASHFYTNYVLMYNTLKDGGQNASALETDMDRPLYTDFLGNIITESGYVVVPAAANTTYYGTDIQTCYPLYTAMFLNAYPSIARNSEGNITLTGNDKGKYVLSVITNSEKTKDIEDLANGEMDIFKENGDISSTRKLKAAYIKTTKEDGSTNAIVDKLYTRLPHYEFALKFNDTTNPLSKAPTGKDEDKIKLINIVESFVDMGPAYIKNGLFKNEVAKVFSLETSYERTVTDINGIGTDVALNSVSAIPTDPSWKVIISVVKDHYLNALNQSDGSVDSILHITKRFIPIARIISNCSTNTEEMLLDNNFINYEDKLKNNPIISSLGKLVETVINNIYGIFTDNILLYTPTFANISIFKDMHLYIKPLTYALLSLMLIVMLFGVILQHLGGRGVASHSQTFISCVLIVLLVLYNLNYHPALTNLIYKVLPSSLLNNKMYSYVGYDIEKRYRTDKNQFFSDVPNPDSKDENKVLIKIKELTNEEVADLREATGETRLEVNSYFYTPKYDQTPMNVVGTDIFLKGNSLYMTVEDLFDKSAVTDIVNVDNTISMAHTIYNEVDNISYFTPYYNILESLVYTINTYSEGCDAQIKLKNYKNTTKTTGRAASYFRSIFFISPDHVWDIKEQTKQQYVSNLNTLLGSELFLSDEIDDENREEEIERYKNQLTDVDNNIDTAFAYLLESLGDLEDWLGIGRVLYLNETSNVPFTEDKRLTTSLTEWFPESIRDIVASNPQEAGVVLDEATVTALKEEAQFKITQINRAVKAYVMNDLSPIADCFSDDTILKLVALRATTEFNKQFSESFGEQFYPKALEPTGLDNKFTLMSSYISKHDIFNSSTDGLSYIVAHKEGWPGLMLVFLDALLRIVAYVIPIAAIAMMIFMPFILLVCYVLRRQRWVQFAFTGMILAFVLSLLRYVNILTYLCAEWITGSVGITGALVINILLSSLTILLARVVVILTIKGIKYAIFAWANSLHMLSDRISNIGNSDYKYATNYEGSRDYASYGHRDINSYHADYTHRNDRGYGTRQGRYPYNGTNRNAQSRHFSRSANEWDADRYYDDGI